MSQINKSVGEYIRELRTNKGNLLRKISFALDIKQSTLAKMEKGQRPFYLTMAPTIAKAIEIDF